MKSKYLTLASFLLLFFLGAGLGTAHAANSGISSVELIPGPGDKEKKKKDKEDDEKKNKMSTKKYKPAAKARKSATNARKALRLKEKQVAGRARVRNFFHRTFNTKFGKPVNFRKRKRRNRWKRGR